MSSYTQEFDLPVSARRVDEYTFEVDTVEQGLDLLRVIPDYHQDGTELIIRQAVSIVPQQQASLIDNVNAYGKKGS